MISDEHQSDAKPLILLHFLDFFNGEKPPPGAAPKRNAPGSNPGEDATKLPKILSIKGTEKGLSHKREKGLCDSLFLEKPRTTRRKARNRASKD